MAETITPKATKALKKPIATHPFVDTAVGDLVFVVHQSPAASARNRQPRRTGWCTVTKVGRTYIYVRINGQDLPFVPETGYSHHAESNVRDNGFGFDVYVAEADYLACEYNKAEYARLVRRLMGPCKLKEFEPAAVSRLHDALDLSSVPDEKISSV